MRRVYLDEGVDEATVRPVKLEDRVILATCDKAIAVRTERDSPRIVQGIHPVKQLRDEDTDLFGAGVDLVDLVAGAECVRDIYVAVRPQHHGFGTSQELPDAVRGHGIDVVAVGVETQDASTGSLLAKVDTSLAVLAHSHGRRQARAIVFALGEDAIVRPGQAIHLVLQNAVAAIANQNR